MKILSLVWFRVLPARFGGQKGTAQFNRYLAQQAELVCLCSSDNEPDGPLPYRLLPLLPAGKGSVARPSVWRLIGRTVAEERPTHVILEYPYHALGAVHACRRNGARLVLHEHNIEYRRFRALGHPGWRLLKAYERWACRQADLLLFKTDEDRRHAVEEFGIQKEKTMLVPYGIDPPQPVAQSNYVRSQWDVPQEAKLLLFAGTLDYAPNAEAVETLYREVAPRLDATGKPYRILICGRNRSNEFRRLDGLQHPRVIRCGEVPDMEPYYAAADLFVNPVRSGGGVQTKVIDALAHNKSVVSFLFGLQGIDWHAAGDKVIAVRDADWDALVSALVEEGTASQPTPAAFLEQYDWRSIARNVAERMRHC